LYSLNESISSSATAIGFFAESPESLAFERGVKCAAVRHAGQRVDHGKFFEVPRAFAQRRLLQR